MSQPFLRLYVKMLKIGCIGFGGGNAVIPIIEKECSDFVDARELDKDILIASITPGALPVEIASGIGRYTAGRIGMVLCSIFMALPGAFATLFLISSISYCNEAMFRQIELISVGVTIFIVTVLLQFIHRSVFVAASEQQNSKKRDFCKIVVLLLVFFLTSGKKLFALFGINGSPFFVLNATQIILSTLVIIICYELFFNKRHPSSHSKKTGLLKKSLADLFVWFGILCFALIIAVLIDRNFIPFLLTGVSSSFLSFGGGDSYLTIVDSMFINTHMINHTDFYTLLLPIINILPGSILCKAMTGMGYLYGSALANTVTGITGGILGFIVSIVASGFIFNLVYRCYQKYEQLQLFITLKYWIRPIVSGLLLNVILTLILEMQNIITKYNLSPAYYVALLITFFLSLLLKFKNLSDTWIILLSIIIMSCMGNLLT